MKKKLLSVVISMITVFSLCILPVSAMRPDSDRVHDGIDVSEFQGDIDFDRVRNIDDFMNRLFELLTKINAY